jgi:hypothetical protein
VGTRDLLLVEDVFVLGVADDQGSLGARTHDELGAIHAGCDGDKRNGAVGILAAAHLALPLAEVEDSPDAVPWIRGQNRT